MRWGKMYFFAKKKYSDFDFLVWMSTQAYMKSKIHAKGS